MSQQGPVIFNGRYELHRRLGRGGMAEVYLARDQMLDRPVAVKVLFPALATDPGFVERFRREAQRAAALNHPNIVSVYDWGEANGTYFIVMEYVEGESLAETIHTEKRVHPDRAAEIASDVAAALAFAHRNGVIHRDVKPGNVLIDREGAVKVADFGIARAISDASDQNLTKTGSVMGTATYFSPEQARGAQLDPRSDLYSLGCVLYEMITGHPPFAGENAVAIAYKHVQEQPVPPRRIDPAIPETLEAIVLKCLAKNPANRYPSGQDMRADLRRYLDGARIMAEPVMAPPMDPGATGVMAPTGYMERTSMVGAPPTTRGRWDGYGDDGYGPYDDDYEDEDEPKRPKSFLVVLALLVVILGGLLFLVARSLGGGDDENAVQVTVPNVIGMTAEEATNKLTEAKLEAKVEEAADTTQEKGRVFDQTPKGTTKADEGSTVTIKVSTGAETFPMPDVANKTRADAIALLTEAKLVPNVVEEASDTVPKDTAIRTDPPVGTAVAENQQVSLVISSGKNAKDVPNVDGKSQAAATTELQTAGFKVAVEQATSETVQAGNVISHSPTGQAAPGATITITVSTGSDRTNVPNVKGLGEAAARQTLTDAGFTPSVTYDTVVNPNQIGKVISQNPDGGQAARGTPVTIVVGQAPGGTTTSTTEP
jgi:eukaryotic-like serine/threonine-protein kinase